MVGIFALGFGSAYLRPKPFLFSTAGGWKYRFQRSEIMSEENELTQVADDLVVTMDYTLTVEDKIIDSS